PSEVNTPGCLDSDEQACPSGTPGQSTTPCLTQLTSTPPIPRASISQPTIHPQTCVPRTVQIIVCPTVHGPQSNLDTSQTMMVLLTTGSG
ncbi:hypothetical protein NDU88_006488, partial [Pleurodeles waltl]